MQKSQKGLKDINPTDTKKHTKAENTSQKPKIAENKIRIKFRKKALIFSFLTAIIVFLALLGGAFLYFKKGPGSLNSGRIPDLNSASNARDLIAKVSKLVELPSGETPTLAAISDITKFKNQPFFSKAKNGDIVLIFSQAKKAYLYDPDTGKLLDIAPILSETGTTPTPSPGSSEATNSSK